MSWHDDLRPPSFRGRKFKLDANTRLGGRRGFTYEFAKSNRSLDEDLGRRVARVVVAAYTIGDNYHREADALEEALKREGGGQLVLPILGSMFMRCETYGRTETREQGGMARFEIAFVDASGSTNTLYTENTRGAVATAAQTLSERTRASAAAAANWV